MTAMTTQQRSQKAAAKRGKLAEKELRHKVRPGIEAAMDRIRDRSSTPEISEVIQLAILKMDAMTDAELVEFLRPPRHKVVISKTLRDKFENESRRELMKNPSDSQLAPLPIGERECKTKQMDILEDA
jgi:peptide subunit release factor 1 (eRF1)